MKAPSVLRSKFVAYSHRPTSPVSMVIHSGIQRLLMLCGKVPGRRIGYSHWYPSVVWPGGVAALAWWGSLRTNCGLHVSDFRAAEHTYHLLVDAANLACPASTGGLVIVQTRLPTHHTVHALISGNPDQFYNEEFAARRLLHYPPVCHLADLSITGKDLGATEKMPPHDGGAELEQIADDQEPLMVLGPVRTIRRPKGRRQYRILVKGTALTSLSRRIHDSVQKMEREYRKGRVKFVVESTPSRWISYLPFFFLFAREVGTVATCSSDRAESSLRARLNRP